LLTILLLLHYLHRRKSQIQTYLEQNEGAGLQHLALKTDDIFETLTLMREAEEDFSGFDLMKRPSDEYYRELPERLGDKLTVSLGASCASLYFSGQHSYVAYFPLLTAILSPNNT
jgi:hypothetical protein